MKNSKNSPLFWADRTMRHGGEFFESFISWSEAQNEGLSAMSPPKYATARNYSAAIFESSHLLRTNQAYVHCIGTCQRQRLHYSISVKFPNEEILRQAWVGYKVKTSGLNSWSSPISNHMFKSVKSAFSIFTFQIILYPPVPPTFWKWGGHVPPLTMVAPPMAGIPYDAWVYSWLVVSSLSLTSTRTTTFLLWS